MKLLVTGASGNIGTILGYEKFHEYER
jgi:hypothetical protein